jgi:hypothetical protein
MTLVSYLLVAYKSNETIMESIRSIASQSGDFSREVIVIDNTPEDNCRESVLSVTPSARITVNIRNRGFTHALNQAIRQSAGDYLFALNPDVRLTPDCTERLLTSLSTDPDFAAVVPQLRNHDDTIQQSVRSFPTFMILLSELSGLSRLLPRKARLSSWRAPDLHYQESQVVEQPMASAMLIDRKAES